MAITLSHLFLLTLCARFCQCWYLYARRAATPQMWLETFLEPIRQATPLQWVCLVESLLVGQGLNMATMNALGKPGIFCMPIELEQASSHVP